MARHTFLCPTGRHVLAADQEYCGICPEPKRQNYGGRYATRQWSFEWQKQARIKPDRAQVAPTEPPQYFGDWTAFTSQENQ